MSEPFSPELADRICDETADGASLRATCDKLGLPIRTVRSWITRNPEVSSAY